MTLRALVRQFDTGVAITPGILLAVVGAIACVADLIDSKCIRDSGTVTTASTIDWERLRPTAYTADVSLCLASDQTFVVTSYEPSQGRNGTVTLETKPHAPGRGWWWHAYMGGLESDLKLREMREVRDPPGGARVAVELVSLKQAESASTLTLTLDDNDQKHHVDASINYPHNWCSFVVELQEPFKGTIIGSAWTHPNELSNLTVVALPSGDFVTHDTGFAADVDLAAGRYLCFCSWTGAQIYHLSAELRPPNQWDVQMRPPSYWASYP